MTQTAPSRCSTGKTDHPQHSYLRSLSYEYNGRILKVHYDRYTASSLPATTPASPTLSSYQSSSSLRSASPFQTTRPNHIVVPAGYTLDFGPMSAPNSPFDQFPPTLQRSYISLSQSNLNLAHSASDVDPLADLLNSVHIPSHQRTTSSPTPSSESKPSLSTLRSSLSSASTSPPSDHSPPLSQNTSQTQSLPSGSASHPNHPGPIAIPPLQPAFSIPMHNMSPGMAQPMISPVYHTINLSPLHHPAAVSGMMTPYGIPITPSMPPFTFTSHFHPMPSPTTSVFPTSSSDIQTSVANGNAPQPETPTAAGGGASAPAPGVTPFSPGVILSPGAFWGRPGAVGSNPFINPAVGAPVHLGGAPFYFAGGSPMGHPLQQQSVPVEPGGYFDQLFMGTPTNGLDNVAREILKDKEDTQPIPNGVTPREDEFEPLEMAAKVSDSSSLTSSPDEQRSSDADESERSKSTATTPATSSESKTPHLPHAVIRAESEPIKNKSVAEPSKHVRSR